MEKGHRKEKQGRTKLGFFFSPKPIILNIISTHHIGVVCKSTRNRGLTGDPSFVKIGNNAQEVGMRTKHGKKKGPILVFLHINLSSREFPPTIDWSYL
jgi:hypothetical protein